MTTHLIWSEQYRKPCVAPSPTDTADSVIAACRASGAVRFYRDESVTVDGQSVDDGGALEEFVIQLRDDVGPELWTEAALRRSLGKEVC